MSLKSLGLLGLIGSLSVLASYLVYGDDFGVKLNIETKFKQSLLDLSKEDFWKEKWGKLKEGKIHGDSLKLTKAKETWKIETMKDACREIYSKAFEGATSNDFLNFKAYCALTYEDKLGKDKFQANKEECNTQKDELYLGDTEFKKFEKECTKVN
ncbi:hypothetical protein A6V39_01225 [Candidatus Mycoplasma haematobovis]|uniref:Uncharacterized protein n=1 Tax=Candidatus Mycoplasma haematobovis TaxID=432608 RepID=A0A1A9QFC9_9MOLU|nr:hypothetical protein [Candidatus Mycoplasma haematobovis]OAL10675.1 hypothetical protein A6V39_01225 [Candidatus Mycoplasma haematobovis]